MFTVRLRNVDPFLLVTAACGVGWAIVTLALTPSGTPFPPDALEYAEVARSLVRGDGYTINMTEFHAGFLSSIRHAPELHGLLEPLFMVPLFAVTGARETMIRVPGVLLASCVGFVTFFVGRHHFGSKTGCLAALCVLFHPSLSYVALLADDDIGASIFALLSFFFFSKGIEAQKGSLWFGLSGVSVALATLQKITGLVLPLALAASALAAQGVWRKVGLRGWLMVLIPALVALGAYGLRNYLAHGGLGFRFSPIDWLAKDRPEAYFALYEQAPSLSDVWKRLGPRRIVELIFVQVRALGHVVRENVLLSIAAPVALVSLRRYQWFAAFVTLYTILLAGAVCVAYHVESRYLAPLVPFLTMTIVAGLAQAIPSADRFVPPAFTKAFVGLSIAVLLGRELWGSIATVSVLGHAAARTGRCDDAIRFVRSSVGVAEPVLTQNPWFVSWKADRAAVVAPTNGEPALLTVIRRYETKWAFVGASAVWAPNLGELLTRPSFAARIRSERIFHGAECDVYRVGASAPKPTFE